ncbi:hypothetical protein B0I35DRAFT_363366 [Stachybotrys elegans]|uniref:Zn(2)-C6 fungal-type domain-containing protein n=1 Tax=Stachybotrys elegans TaxID=80388 RepID=A0A8K0SA28_9HYPO|nr:hypothetical protein B0I35DRAFT_363366 [Stachybotrys elegans]
MVDGRHKRCDGESPCERCKDHGLACIAGVRKKTHYKQLPKGYAEVLEHTQFALVATVHKLYAMVRSQQQWDLGEPDLNDKGRPVIHNIASKLGCIRPNSDIDPPVHSRFPKDEAGLAEQQKERNADMLTKVEAESQSSCNLSDKSIPSEQDHSDFEANYGKNVFGGNSVMNMSPQSFGGYHEFDVDPVTSTVNGGAAMLPTYQAQVMQQHSPQWATIAPRRTSIWLPEQFLQQGGTLTGMDMLAQSLMESEFSTINPHVSSCPKLEVTMSLGDPIICSGFDSESMRLQATSRPRYFLYGWPHG